MLQAASIEVEADTRRLAIDTGWSERRVGEVLTLLTADTDSWLQRAGERTDKARGQRFRLHPKFSTDQTTQTRAQVLARPTPALPPPDALTARALLIAELQHRLAPLRTDTFAAPHSLGRAAGHIYRLLTRTHGRTAGDIADAAGFTVRQVRTYLGRLTSVGLSRRSRSGWLQTPRTLEPIAETLDVDGYLERREARYRAERSRWGLWLDELRWRRQRGAHKPRRRRLEQLTLTGLEERTRVRYPRGPGGRARHGHVLSALLALQDTQPGVRFK
nr:FaeA/PapI family transcriptional regulator [Frigoribacterium sp. CFBP 8766]